MKLRTKKALAGLFAAVLTFGALAATIGPPNWEHSPRQWHHAKHHAPHAHHADSVQCK